MFLHGKNKPIFIDTPFNIITKQGSFRILLLRQDRIGDVLISTSVIRILRQNLPDAEIDILLSKKNIGVKQAVIKYINNFWLYDKNILHTILLLRKLRKRKYDVVVDMLDNASTTSSIFVKYIKPKFSIGIDKENRNIYTHIVPLLDKNSFHPVERLAQILLAFGINPSQQDLSIEYDLSEDETESALKKLGAKTKPIRLGINLAGSDLSKFWGVENNIKLINKIQQNYPDIEIVLFAEEKYSTSVKIIVEQTNIKPAPAVKSVKEFASLLSLCDIIITTDTAAVHFASAWKKPCLALYIYNKESGTGMPWYPYKTANRILTTSEKLSDITVDEVYQAFENLYDEAIKHKI